MHALEEIRRVLAPDGILIDLRPLADNWRVEVVSLREIKRTGRVEDLPTQTKGDLAANEAMQAVAQRGWFKREQDELFPLFYSWDTPSEMEEFVDDEIEARQHIITEKAGFKMTDHSLHIYGVCKACG